jgi:hypothetical protein
VVLLIKQRNGECKQKAFFLADEHFIESKRKVKSYFKKNKQWRENIQVSLSEFCPTFTL